jgi:predicted Zn-dependent peptidase
MLNHHDITLPNGLRVVLVPMPAIHTAVASLYLRVGSRFETAEDNGVSHFLEHMLFRGTRSLGSAHEQALAFERLGATLYAATHVDHGVMSVSVPPANLSAVLALLGEVTTAPRFGEIEVERGIVREEILEDLDDDGRDIDADNLARALIYERHAVLAIAGRIGDVDACAREVERCFGAMPRGRRVDASPPPNAQKKPRFSFVENTSSQTDLRVAFRATSERDPREPAVEVLMRVLDDGMSTRLYERICDRLGLCYDVSGMFEAYEDDGVLDVAAGAQHERAIQVAKEIFELLHELATEGPSAEELRKAKDRHLWSVEAMLDDAEAVAGFYGLAALAGIARTPAARHEDLARVTSDEVRAAAETVFRPDRMSVVAVGLLSEAEERKLERAVRAF